MTVFGTSPSLVTVDEAKAHLRAQGIIVTPVQLDTLQWLCSAATDAVERDLSRVLVPRQVTEVHDGGGSVILHQSPVLSITSVTESGSLLGTDSYFLHAVAAILYRGSPSSPARFARGVQNVQVVYEAGFTDPPVSARKVVLNLVQGTWQASQQAPHPALTDFDEQAMYQAQAALAPIEQRAYDSLRAVGIG